MLLYVELELISSQLPAMSPAQDPMLGIAAVQQLLTKKFRL
jgi:hypothetical protein